MQAWYQLQNYSHSNSSPFTLPSPPFTMIDDKHQGFSKKGEGWRQKTCSFFFCVNASSYWSFTSDAFRDYYHPISSLPKLKLEWRISMEYGIPKSQSLNKEELFPLICLLILSNTVCRHLQGTIPLVDIIQSLCTTRWRCDCMADQLCYINTVRESFFADCLYSRAVWEVIQTWTARECPIADGSYTITNAYILQVCTIIKSPYEWNRNLE